MDWAEELAVKDQSALNEPSFLIRWQWRWGWGWRLAREKVKQRSAFVSDSAYHPSNQDERDIEREFITLMLAGHVNEEMIPREIR